MKFQITIKIFNDMSRSEKMMLAKRCLPVVFKYVCEGWGMSVSYTKAGKDLSVRPAVVRILAVQLSNLSQMAYGIKKLNLTVNPNLYSELIIINNEH